MANNSFSNSGNVEGNLIQGSTVKGDVSAHIKKSLASSNPEETRIKEIMTQLKTAIETEPTLDEKNRVKALKQVGELEKAAQNSNEGEVQGKADNAITMLKGIFSGLQTGATLLEAWNNILPLLSKLFGI
jgi:hypothetical protein